MNRRRFFLGVSLWSCLLLPVGALALQFESLYVFGDSLSDGGRAYQISGGFPPFPYPQRFTNGPVAVENLAAALGVPLAPRNSPAGTGTNYAVGGALAGTGNYVAERTQSQPQVPALADTGMTNQLNEFLASGPFDPATSLFVVWGGPNDIYLEIDRMMAGNPSPGGFPAVIGDTLGQLANIVGTLGGLGARHLLVPNLPDLGTTPEGLASGPAASGELTALSQGYNGGLASTLSLVGSFYPDLDIMSFDTFAALHAIAGSPGIYGLTNVTDPYLGPAGFGAGADPDTFLFWDGVHPTARGHQILGQMFTARVVPEPSTLILLVSGLCAVASRVRRR